MKKIFAFLILLVAFQAAGNVPGNPPFPLVIEAENHIEKCAAGMKTGGSMWAMGKSLTPEFWGREPGDEIKWSLSLKSRENNLKIAVRYSYSQGHYTGFSGHHNPARILELTIGGGNPIPVAVPDTGWWEHFETTHITLPPLDAGTHEFRLRSVVFHTVTNVDSFIFYKGNEKDLPATWRGTRVALSESKRFALLMTPNARPGISRDQIFADFNRIYEHYYLCMGWGPPTPIQIHVIEDQLWDNPGATAYQNQWGVYFRAGGMAKDQGNWCHEMTHMFYCAHFPGWFDESSVRTLTTFNWMPELFPRFEKPGDNPYYKRCESEGRALLQNPGLRVDSPDPVHYAIRLKYGPDVFKRFFHLCGEAGKKGEIDFTPGRHLTNAEIVKYMSLATGEDVVPLYRRWRGFEYTPELDVEEILATSEKEGMGWRFTTVKPRNEWIRGEFDDSSWEKGTGGFGDSETPGGFVRHEWKTRDIWLRRSFTLGKPVPEDLLFRVHHDEDAEIYLNGTLAAILSGFTKNYKYVPISREAHEGLEPGGNVIAVHCRQTEGGQYIDVGVVREITGKGEN